MPSAKECLSDCLTAAAIFWLLFGICMPIFDTGNLTWWAEQVLAIGQGTDGHAQQTNDIAHAASETKVDAPPQ